MYAVIRTGGKQQKVKPGDVIEVELLHADGETVTFQPLLVVDDDGTTYGKAARRAKGRQGQRLQVQEQIGVFAPAGSPSADDAARDLRGQTAGEAGQFEGVGEARGLTVEG